MTAGRCGVSDRDREKWNARYRDGAYAERTHPAELLARWAPQVVAWHRRDESNRPLRALDVACGAGRNAVWLAVTGFHVDAVDIAEAGLAVGRARAAAAGVAVNWHGLDLDGGLPAALTGYDLIAVIRYLNRPLLQALPARLGVGGLLVCEVHLETAAAVVGPGAGAFRAAPGELASLLEGLEVLVLEEEIVTDPDGRAAAVARLVGRRVP